MLSLIDVKCPHCGARGQIMVPPPGAIILAPCPECQGLVVVFCGHVLALKKETMLHGSIKDKREHLLTVLTDFLRQRVAEVVTEESAKIEAAKAEPIAARNEGAAQPLEPAHARNPQEPPKKSPISQDEMEHFRRDELRLLDNPDYFKAIFG